MFAQIRAAWLEHLVLRFRGQKLSDPQVLAFSRNFGELDPPGPNPLGRPFLADHPEMNVISNIKQDGVPIGGLGDGEAIWHADMTYVERPPMAAILYAIELPPAGGDTYWANMYAAYESLPETLKKRIEGREAVHDATYNSAGVMRKGYTDVTDPRTAPGARHRLVRTHPRDRPPQPVPRPPAQQLRSRASSSRRAKRCSTSCGSMRRSRNSPSARSGASATFWSGTTAAPCTAATPSIRARAGCCTGRRSGQ